MKVRPIPVFMAGIVAVLVVAGCAARNAKSSKATHADSTSIEKSENGSQRNPEVGETKAEIRARYGEPKSKTKSGDDEIWIYHINWGRAMTVFAPLSLVTANHGYKAKYCVITFDHQDKVIHWTFNR